MQGNYIRRQDRVELKERLAEEYPGYHPVIALAHLAHSTKSEIMKFQCHKEIAQYIEPKRAALSVSQDNTEGTGVLLIKQAPDRSAWIEAAQASMESTMKLVQGTVIEGEQE